jgi:hypothetical protein
LGQNNLPQSSTQRKESALPALITVSAVGHILPAHKADKKPFIFRGEPLFMKMQITNKQFH